MSWENLALLTFLCLIIQAFFTMVEMACVSFNKVRLEYYVSKGNLRAKWLSRIISRPILLFGATMLGVNTSMLLGSECARRLYFSLGLTPDWAPLTQIILVVVFAEIAPMVAGRRYAEHAAMIGIPILYGFSIVVRPIIWFFNGLSGFIYRLMKAPKEIKLSLSRDELQKAIEEGEEADTIVSNIFGLKNKIAQEVMLPLSSFPSVSSSCSIKEMRELLTAKNLPFLPIFHRSINHIVAIAYPRDLIRAADHVKVRDLARPPWFIVQTTSVMDILKQFRSNNQILAVVLDEKGQAAGILTLDEIIDEIFEQSDTWLSLSSAPHAPMQVMIDRTFPGDTLLSDLKSEYNVDLNFQDATTLEELCEKILGHAPAKGDELRLEDYELKVEEAPLIGSLEISIKSVSS